MKVVPTSCSFQHISQCSFVYKVNSKLKFTLNNKVLYLFLYITRHRKLTMLMMHFNMFLYENMTFIFTATMIMMNYIRNIIFQLYPCHTVLTFTITEKIANF